MSGCIIWGFEFQFLRNILQFDSVFAKTPLKPIKAVSGNLEFRCTYSLTNLSLANCAKIYNLSVDKLIGDLDYTKARGYSTPLTKLEYEYCIHDVLIVYELLKRFKEQYRTFGNIPLTSTGRIRRSCFAKMKQREKRIAKKCTPTVNEFERLRKTFAGAYVHANKYNTGIILPDVDSFDFSSSYPAVMLTCKYPMTRFVKVQTAAPIEDSNKCFFYLLTLFDVSCPSNIPYISYHKVQRCNGAELDNGRVTDAQSLTVWVTDVDLTIIQKVYRFKKMVIHEAWVSKAGFLPDSYRRYLLQLFADKTSLKGLPDRYDEYMKSKEAINALYGMMCTNDIRDTVVFSDSEGWNVQELTRDDISKALAKKSQSPKTFLNYAWGVWVTAHARKALITILLEVGNDYVYADTDSCKMVHSERHKAAIDRYNERMKKLTVSIAKDLECDDIYPPKKPNGEVAYLGVMEHESEYPVKQFKTLGAKKYAYIDRDGEKHLSLSGVTKRAAREDPGFRTLEDFSPGYVFTEEYSGRSTARYISDQAPIIFKDYTGREQYVSDQRYVINLEPGTYKLSISPDYFDVLHNSTHLGAFREKVDKIKKG